MLPEVPVNVTVDVAATALSAAVNVVLCATPGARLNVVGFAVTPAGSPMIATVTVPANELTAAADAFASRGRFFEAGRTAGADPERVEDLFDHLHLRSQVVGHLLDGVSEPVLERAFEYWRHVDRDLGDRIEKGVRAG